MNFVQISSILIAAKLHSLNLLALEALQYKISLYKVSRSFPTYLYFSQINDLLTLKWFTSLFPTLSSDITKQDYTM